MRQCPSPIQFSGPAGLEPYDEPTQIKPASPPHPSLRSALIKIFDKKQRGGVLDSWRNGLQKRLTLGPGLSSTSEILTRTADNAKPSGREEWKKFIPMRRKVGSCHIPAKNNWWISGSSTPRHSHDPCGGDSSEREKLSDSWNEQFTTIFYAAHTSCLHLAIANSASIAESAGRIPRAMRIKLGTSMRGEQTLPRWAAKQGQCYEPHLLRSSVPAPDKGYCLERLVPMQGHFIPFLDLDKFIAHRWALADDYIYGGLNRG